MNIGIAKLMDGETVAKNTTAYTDSIDARRMRLEPNAGVLITSSAGSITITQQCSDDNEYWFDPIDSSGSATGAVGATLTSIGSGTWIDYDPITAPYIRFKVVENNTAEATVTVEFIFPE